MMWRLEVSQHAAEREATRVHRELARGLGGLATVAATAPWLGLLWTVWCIAFNTFLGVDGEKTAIMATLADALSQAIAPTAFGLCVAIIATWGYRHFRSQLTQFDLEMRVTAETLPGLIAAGLRHRI
jgi:biopolymer transport protein ExbB/TolQ